MAFWAACSCPFDISLTSLTAAVAAVPEQLAVVQVQAGETLQQLAARVAPDAPAGARAGAGQR